MHHAMGFSQQGRDEPLFFMKVTIIVVLDKSVIMFLVMIVVIMVKEYFWNKSGCSSELVPESQGFPGCTFPPWLTSTAGWTSLGVIFGIIIICCNFSFPINSQSFASNSFGPIYFVFLHTSTTIIIIINITVGWFAAGPRASGWGGEAHKVGDRTNLTIWEYNSPTPKQISIKAILNCDLILVYQEESHQRGWPILSPVRDKSGAFWLPFPHLTTPSRQKATMASLR